MEFGVINFQIFRETIWDILNFGADQWQKQIITLVISVTSPFFSSPFLSSGLVVDQWHLGILRRDALFEPQHSFEIL
jgi:hypothetical protein